MLSVIYSGQQERTQTGAERGGSVSHISQGRTAGCHTAAPTEAHTSVRAEGDTSRVGQCPKEARSQGRSNRVCL